jgi:hypothetical protein
MNDTPTFASAPHIPSLPPPGLRPAQLVVQRHPARSKILPAGLRDKLSSLPLRSTLYKNCRGRLWRGKRCRKLQTLGLLRHCRCRARLLRRGAIRTIPLGTSCQHR